MVRSIRDSEDKLQKEYNAKPCSEFKNYPMEKVPFRCFKENK